MVTRSRSTLERRALVFLCFFLAFLDFLAGVTTETRAPASNCTSRDDVSKRFEDGEPETMIWRVRRTMASGSILERQRRRRGGGRKQREDEVLGIALSRDSLLRRSYVNHVMDTKKTSLTRGLECSYRYRVVYD
jgi:hypothetical protein